MRTLNAILVGLLTLPALAGCLSGGPDEALSDTAGILVWYNAVIWTADDELPWAEAMAVDGNRIVAVGNESELRAAYPDATWFDLDGRFVMPGMHDTHNHFLRVAESAAGPADFEPWPPGWDPVQGTLAQQVTASGHIGTWANGNWERVQDGHLPAPPEDEHDHGIQFPEGRLAANDLGFGMDASATDVDAWEDGIKAGLSVAAKYGLTSSVEAGASFPTLEILKQMEEDGELTARFNLYFFPEDLEALIDQGIATGHGTEFGRVLGLKIYSDGWLGPRTAALRDLYNDRPHQGFAFFTQDEVDDYVTRAHAGGLKVTAHTIGDRATEMLLSAYERALQGECVGHSVCDDPRFTLEHVQLVQPDLLNRMVGLRLVPSIQLSFATSDAPWAELALGEDRLEHAYIWQTMVQNGIVIGGSSDFPIEVLPPLWGVERAVTRQDLNGEPAGGFMTEQALNLDQALRSVTINAAYLEFREDELGSLEAGKLADFIVLEQNLFEAEPDTIADTDVLLTVVDGRAVHQAGALAAMELP